ncbi:hypothetical protein CY658_31525 [Variovorax sp. RO1]|uniref:hypothetical protein n=1 Tax=unclassified Variovorax TaxID=663243 RepID=UPI000C716775|nr:hypothetical protein [Variovorax sp. RO1]PLC01464.1 hypothetical protein CY658_31525 [Variovorax sp. RO1]
MNRSSARRQARNDDRENSNLFVYGAGVALLVFIGALLFFYAIDRRGEGPAHEGTPPAVQQQAPQNAPPATSDTPSK